MESLTLTNFAGLNLASPEMELLTDPVESPNIINAVMEEGTIFCRAPQNKYYSFGDGKKVSSLYVGKLGNTKLEFAQVDNKIFRRGGSFEVWWNNSWTYKRIIEIRNNSVEKYEGAILDLRLPAGFDYSGFKTNGEDIRFISWDNQAPTELSYWIKRWGKGISQTTLTTGIDAVVTTIPVVSTSDYPANGIILIEDEKIYYGSKDATNFKDCIRGYESTASAHLTGKAVNYEGCIYVKIPIIEAMTTKKIEMYFGNATAEAKSDISFGRSDCLYWQYWEGENKTEYTGVSVFLNWIAEEGFPLGPVGQYTWGYAVFPGNPPWHSPASTSRKINFSYKIKLLTNRSGIYGFVVKSDNENNFKNLICVGFHYSPPDFEWRGITIGSYNESVFLSPDRTLAYNWQKNNIFEISIEIDRLTRLIIAIIKDSLGRVIIARQWTCPFSITALRHGFLWHWPGGFLESFYVTQRIYAWSMLSFADTSYTLGIQQTKTSDVEWSELFTGNSTKPYQILNFADVTKGKNYIIFINEDEVVRKWDGTAVTELPMPNTKCKFGLVHKRRLWLFNFTGLYDGSKLWYSNIDAIDTLTDWQTKGVNNVEYINQGDGFEITAVGIMSDCIVIWKENTAYLLYGDIPNHAVKKLNIDVGCLAWRSVSDWEDGNFFLSRRGIHYIRGATAETPMIFTVDNIRTDNLATKIMPLFNNLNTSYLKNAIGCVWKDRYFCAVPLYKSEVNDILLVSDYKAGWWSYWVPPEPITAMFVDPINNVFYIGTTNGNIRIQETRNLKIDEALKEDGNFISSRYETGYMDLGIPNIRKRLRFLELLFSKDVSIEMEVDKIIKPIGEFKNSSILTKKRIPLLNIGRFYKLVFKNFNKQVHSANLFYEYLRT